MNVDLNRIKAKWRKSNSSTVIGMLALPQASSRRATCKTRTGSVQKEYGIIFRCGKSEILINSGVVPKGNIVTTDNFACILEPGFRICVN